MRQQSVIESLTEGEYLYKIQTNCGDPVNLSDLGHSYPANSSLIFLRLLSPLDKVIAKLKALCETTDVVVWFLNVHRNIQIIVHCVNSKLGFYYLVIL